MEPASAPARPGGATAATPTDQTDLIAAVADRHAGLLPGFATGASQLTASSGSQGRRPWRVGRVAVAGLAVLAVLTVLVASRIGDRNAADAGPDKAAVLTPTGGNGSGAVSWPASETGSARAAHRPRGRAQALRIAGYLTHSAHARHGIGAAITAISGCTHIRSAVSTLHHAATIRTRIVTALASPHVSALPHGAALVADLRQAMQSSATADRHYAAWGQTVTGCHRHAPGNAQLAAAQQSDTAATAAKQRFADRWNPIAARYRLAKQNAHTI